MKPGEDPDVQLMLAVKNDDRRAFEVLFRKYAGQIIAFASSLVGSNARGEEIAQATFVQVYRARKRYEPRARFSTWLYRIAKNLCLSEIRRPEHRYVAVDPEERQSGSLGMDAFPDSGAQSVEDAVAGRERVEQMRRALRCLPAQQKAALLLARMEGLSYADVAQALGCSVSAVKSLIHRATVALREQMKSGEHG